MKKKVVTHNSGYNEGERLSGDVTIFDAEYRAWDNSRKEWIPNNLLFMDYDGQVLAGDIYNPPYVLIGSDKVSFSTGLKDINNKKIYTNDIVDINGQILVVRFGRHVYDSRDELVGGLVREVYGYYLESSCGSWQLNIMVELDKVKIVGNTFENLELLHK